MTGKVLVVDDEPSMCEFLSIALSRDGYDVETTTDPLAVIDGGFGGRSDVAIVDMRMPTADGADVLRAIKQREPEMPVIMITAYASVESAVDAMRMGAYDYITKPFQVEEMRAVLRKALEHKKLGDENKQLHRMLSARRSLPAMGRSPQMRAVYDKAAKIAQTNSTVLIFGESGTWKELLARAIHYGSLRAERPFVAVDCGALPETLLESELFGHVRGAFTGAVAEKEGLFDAADTGTIFLDEVGEIGQAVQVKLLRVLQEREVKPVGGTANHPVDVRVIAATNRDLEAAATAGTFREDLFYRLAVIPMSLPPLRDRDGDVPILAREFLREYAEANGKHIEDVAEDAMHLLCSYRWPGNVRELENAIEQAVVLASGTHITSEDLPSRVRSLAARGGPVPDDDEMNLKDKVEYYERELIVRELRRSGGNRYRAAKLLGVSRQNLQYKIKKYNLAELGLFPAKADDGDE